jgi:hypothetical protein
MRALLRAVAIALASTRSRALEPRRSGRQEPVAPSAEVCVDERGNEVPCAAAGRGAYGTSLQDQFTEAIRHARRLKGLDGGGDAASLTRRKKDERKAAMAAKRRAAAGPSAAPEKPAPTFSPGCADKACDRRARQAARRAAHAEEVAARPRAYASGADLAAALDADLAAGAALSGPRAAAPSAAIPVRSPTR